MMKVLVVEDEETVRRDTVLGVDWTALDCVVVGEAADGEEALEAVERYDPSLIVTGLDMPRTDGLELLRRLREAGNDVCIIVLTARDDFESVRSAFRLGAADYLLKPRREGELERAVAGLRGRMGAGQERREAAAVFPGLKKGDKGRYVLDAMAYIEEHYGDAGISVGAVARYLGISEGHLSHIFKRETDYTPLNYLTRCRIHKAMELLRGRLKVYEVAERVGYRDITYFSATFKKLVGMSPSEYQDTCR